MAAQIEPLISRILEEPKQFCQSEQKCVTYLQEIPGRGWLEASDDEERAKRPGKNFILEFSEKLVLVLHL